MNPKDKNSEHGWNALFKTVNHQACPPDTAFLTKLREKSLDAFEAASHEASKPKGSEVWRLIMKNRMIRISAAAVIIIAALISLQFLGLTTGTSAYARVVEQLTTARTLIYTMITPGNIEGGPAIETQCIYKDPGLLRATTSDDVVTIMDGSTGKGLCLIRPAKVFMEMDYQGMPHNPANDPWESVARLRELPARADKVLEAKDINGRLADGYQVVTQDLITTVWIDRDSRELVRVEQEYVSTPNMNVILTDFQFDQAVDDVLFSLTPPEGYQLQSYYANGADLGEQDFIEFMRTWSSLVKDGTFPPTVNPLQIGKISMEMGDQGKFVGEWTQQQKDDFSQSMYRGLMFFGKLPESSNWRYAGANVQYGDAQTAIFWYRPQGSTTYRVIYGDLSVKDVLPEDLPK